MSLKSGYKVKIAICDDESHFVDLLEGKIETILTKNGLSAQIQTFSSGDELIESTCKNNITFSILFLDVNMEGMNGFEAAEILRKMDSSFVLVFLTSMEGLGYEGYKYEAFRYVRKTHIDEELSEALLKAASNVAYADEVCKFKTKRFEEISLKSGEIMYFELIRRRIAVCTRDSYYELLTGKWGEYKEKFENRGFVLVCRSYLVNMKYVDKFSAHSMFLTNHTEISLGQNKDNIDEIKRKFYRYKKGRQ